MAKHHEVVYIHKRNGRNEYFKQGKKPKQGSANKAIYARGPRGFRIHKTIKRKGSQKRRFIGPLNRPKFIGPKNKPRHKPTGIRSQYQNGKIYRQMRRR